MESVKADFTKLFQLGFKPRDVPCFGVKRLTVAKYYREWHAASGKAAWWRRCLVKLLLQRVGKGDTLC